MAEEQKGQGRIETELTAIIQVYYQERIQYREKVARALLEGSVVPGRIIFWDNSGRQSKMPKSTEAYNGTKLDLVWSSFNTLLGRYAAALMCATPYVLIQDDDLTVGEHTVRDLMRVARQYPTNIVGASGVWLNEDDDEHSYSRGSWVDVGQAEVVLGRLFCCHRRALVPGIAAVLESGLEPGRADDIVMSMANRNAGASNRVVMCEITNLDEGGVGLSHEPNHIKERDAMVGKYREVV